MIMRSLIFAMFTAALLIVTVPTVAQQVAIPVSPQLRVIIEPNHVLRNGAHVQGQVLLRVILTSPYPFAAIDFAMPEITGARVITLIKPKTRTIHIYEKTGYAHETRLSLFPEQSGTLVIPPITIMGSVTNEAGESELFDLSNPAVEIPVHPIDPALEASWWMVADAVEITENWTPEPDQFRVGDTVRRHVDVVAYGVSVEQLPHIEQYADQGYAMVGAWQDGKTDFTKTGLVARLKQTWDIRIQSREVMYISPIEIHYWDAVANQPAVARLLPKRVEPLARDPDAMRRNLVEAAMAAHQGRRLGVFVLLALPAAACLLLLVLIFCAARLTRADRRLLAESGSDIGAVNGLSEVLRWSQGNYGLRGARALSGLRGRLSAAGRDPLDRLEEAVFDGKNRPIDNRAVARRIVSAARRGRVRALFRRLMTHFDTLQN
jgi:hypothetical protein